MSTRITWPFIVSVLVMTLIVIVWTAYAIKQGKLKLDEVLKRNNIEPLLSSSCCSNRFITIYRIFCGLYCFGVLTYSIGINGGTPFTFYTVWNWTLLTVYFLVVAIMGFCQYFLDKPIPETNGFNNLRGFVWIMYKIECTQVLLVDIILWTVIYFSLTDDERKYWLLTFTSMNMHVTNLFFIYFDLLINNIPFKNFQFIIFIQIWGISYIYFQWIQVQWSGVYNYGFLDTEEIGNLFMYFMLFVLNIIFGLFAMGITKLKESKLVPCYIGHLSRKDSKQGLNPTDMQHPQYVNKAASMTPTGQPTDDVLL